MVGGQFMLEVVLGPVDDADADVRVARAIDATWATGWIDAVRSPAESGDLVLLRLPDDQPVPARLLIFREQSEEDETGGPATASSDLDRLWLLIELSELDFLDADQFDSMLSPHLAAIGIAVCEAASAHHAIVGWQADDAPEAEAHYRDADELPDERWIGHVVRRDGSWVYVAATERFGG